MKTSELTGAALDWAAAKCEGVVSDDIDDFCLRTEGEYCYSTDWAQAGAIIERERIRLNLDGDDWIAFMMYCNEDDAWLQEAEEQGPTPLIAAMRCYVASKLGDEIEIPNELFNQI